MLQNYGSERIAHMMLRLLINNASIFPIDEETFQSNPLYVFEQFYEQNGLKYTTHFDEWLGRMLLPHDAQTRDKKQNKRYIHKMLATPELLKHATLRLYDNQFLLTEQNWPAIEEVITHKLEQKRTRTMKLHKYTLQKKTFEVLQGKVLSL